MRTFKLIVATTAFCLCASISDAQAGIFSKSLKAAAKAGTAAKVLTRAEAVALAAGLGTGAVYIETGGGRVIFEILGAQPLRGSVDNLFDLSKELQKLPASGQHKFVLTKETVQELGSDLEKLNHHSLFVVEPDLAPLKLVSHLERGTRTLFKELEPGLLTPIESKVTPDLLEVLKEPAKRENILVASVLPDSELDAISLLAKAAGDRLLGNDALSKAIDSGSLKTFKGKTVVLVGHVEDGAFVAKHANGSVQRIDIARLEAMAEESGVTLIGGGCSSFCNGSKTGFLNEITDAELSNNLKQALDASTLGEMLGAFGKNNPLVVSKASLEEFSTQRTLELAERKHLNGSVQAGTFSLRVFHPARSAVLASLLDTTRGVYLIGFLCMAFMFKTNRNAFKRSYPLLPSPTLPTQQLAYALRLLLREAVFLIFSPLFLALVVAAIFLGGWQSRKGLLEFLWSFFAAPLKALGTLITYILGAALMMLVLGLLMAVIFGLGIPLTVMIFGTQGWIFWTLLPLCLIYWGIAGTLAYKLYRAINTSTGESHNQQATPP
jgi:septum formation inhibitor MinC